MGLAMYDLVVIGGGFFGCMLAQIAPGKVCLVEKESDLFTKASRNNQARIHNGYHYPRHYLTARSSHSNFSRFVNEFNEAVSTHQTFLYPIAKGSKTSAKKFYKTFKELGLPIQVSGSAHKDLFNMEYIEEVFVGEEGVLNADILEQIMFRRLQRVDIRLNSEVTKIEEHAVHTTNGVIKGKKIILCVYANTNDLLRKSGLPELPIRIEHTVMPIVKTPSSFKDIAITIMDGDFFSVYPFPTKDAHTIHHVALTPTTNKYKLFYNDVIKYIPALSEMKHVGDIVEDKAILMENEIDDGRPILYKKDYNLTDFTVVVGGKLDNIYDLFRGMAKGLSINLNTE